MFAVVLDLVSTPDARVLVPVLVHLGTFRNCFFAIATRTVVVIVVLAAETVSVAAVVSGPTVWVHHVWSAHRDRLLQSSSASLAFLALRVVPHAAVPQHT